MKDKFLEVIGECSAYKAQMEADPDAKAQFADAYDTFLLRLDFMKHVLGDSQGSDPDEDVRQFTAFKASEQVRDAMKFSEPHPELKQVLTFSQARVISTTIECTTADEAEELKTTLNKTFNDMTDMAVHLRGQLTRLRCAWSTCSS